MDIEAYDFPKTMGIWKSQREDSVKYKHLATKKFIQTLADEKGVDYTTVEGFKEILPELTADSFRYKPINRWGTTLSGMIQKVYNNSPSATILDLLANDKEFTAIQDEGLEVYDFQKTNDRASLK